MRNIDQLNNKADIPKQRFLHLYYFLYTVVCGDSVVFSCLLKGSDGEIPALIEYSDAKTTITCSTGK